MHSKRFYSVSLYDRTAPLSKDSPDERSPYNETRLEIQLDRSSQKQRIKHFVETLCQELCTKLLEHLQSLGSGQAALFENRLHEIHEQAFQPILQILSACSQHIEPIQQTDKGREQLVKQTKERIQAYAIKKKITNNTLKMTNSHQANRQLQQINHLLDQREQKSKQNFNFTFSSKLLNQNKENSLRQPKTKQSLQRQKPTMTFDQYKKML